jgi:hypothetical protein
MEGEASGDRGAPRGAWLPDSVLATSGVLGSRHWLPEDPVQILDTALTEKAEPSLAAHRHSRAAPVG